jgi:hypothetical protein
MVAEPVPSLATSPRRHVNFGKIAFDLHPDFRRSPEDLA